MCSKTENGVCSSPNCRMVCKSEVSSSKAFTSELIVVNLGLMCVLTARLTIIKFCLD